ncbi:hypothetical protein D3C76_1519510 [compost metagenome]
MAQIQKCTLAVFPLITRHNFSLDAASAFQTVFECFRIKREQRFGMLYTPMCKRFVANQAVLQHFR